ncbi:MAG: nucleotidyltransferase family protein [Pseudomonadota bacterium]|nr:nucleotidyltransferase family protein [Pseudomonadota bacterium]
MSRVDRAMILAAGLGLRMRPLTNDKPKALVTLRNKTLLDRALEKCRAAGATSLIVNTHYKSEMIIRHVSAMRDVAVSEETELLETGGGVAKALPMLGGNSFFVVNCDSVWLDADTPALLQLARHWCETKMDALLLLHSTTRAVGYDGSGDFNLNPDGRLKRRTEGSSAPHVFMGVQILHSRLFEGCAIGQFSLNRLYDRALEARRLFGLKHDGTWFHVGTPEDLVYAERWMSAGT